MIPWNEKIPLLSINPDAASRWDIANLAADLMEANKKAIEQADEIADLEACIQDAQSLLLDYDGCTTVGGLKKLIDNVVDLLATHKPMERIIGELK